MDTFETFPDNAPFEFMKVPRQMKIELEFDHFDERLAEMIAKD